MSPAMLGALIKLALAHAAHTLYLQARVRAGDIADAETRDYLSRKAYDVALAYAAVHSLLSDNALRGSASASVVAQAAVWRRVFEAQAYTHWGEVCLRSDDPGEAITAAKQAQPAWHLAELAATKAPGLMAEIRLCKGLTERLLKVAEQANATAKRPIPGVGTLRPLEGTGHPPRALEPQYEGLYPSDPFEMAVLGRGDSSAPVVGSVLRPSGPEPPKARDGHGGCLTPPPPVVAIPAHPVPGRRASLAVSVNAPLVSSSASSKSIAHLSPDGARAPGGSFSGRPASSPAPSTQMSGSGDPTTFHRRPSSSPLQKVTVGALAAAPRPGSETGGSRNRLPRTRLGGTLARVKALPSFLRHAFTAKEG
eukprot:TRINITY_DN908_c0_g1_i1.p1 TRINITY_DN908_c0_g1~~TRINITY_DN908_c0_g1_i1.p1  ORF type:complete len:366 (-),score=20.48 TRINITY_DN908_c0_g1_i1:842-1939(-)